MTAAEAAVLLTLCSAFDGRTVGEAAARAWADVLDDVTLEEGQLAVRAWYRTERKWMMPADVRELVLAARAEARLAAGPPPPPAADPDDPVAYFEEVRAQRAARSHVVHRIEPGEDA